MGRQDWGYLLVVVGVLAVDSTSTYHGGASGLDMRPRYIAPVRFDDLATIRGSYHVWSPKLRYFGCLVPKAGCTSWLEYIYHMHLPADLAKTYERGLAKYHSISHMEHGLHFRAMDSRQNTTAIEAVLNDPSYFKFVVARHPWHRLLSAYRSKYEGMCKADPVCFEKHFGVPANGQDDITFHDFVRLLSKMPPRSLDPHFRPATLLCELTRIAYNYTGDLTNTSDNDYISARVGFPVPFSVFTEEKRMQYNEE